MNAPGEPTSPNPSSSAETSSVTKPDRPCDVCRRRKSKCVVKPGSTTCILCEFHNQVCTFDEQPVPRGKRKAVVPEPIRDSKRRSLSERSRNDQVTSERLPIRDYADLQGDSLLKTTLGLQNHRYATYVGASAEHDPKILALRPYDQTRAENNEEGGSFRKVASSVYFHQHPDSDTPDHEQDIEVLDAIESAVSPYGEDLIRLYFRIVHPSFPILHKKVSYPGLKGYYRTETL